MPNTINAELTPRKTPSQRRSQQRVEGILDACATLLHEVGPDGVNTNSIAQQAGIPVSSLYQYFPNKHAVLVSLMDRYLEQINQLASGFQDEQHQAMHWTDLTDAVIDVFMREGGKHVGLGPLWNTLQAHPALYSFGAASRSEQLRNLRDLLIGYNRRRDDNRFTDEELSSVLNICLDAVVPVLSRAITEQDKNERNRLIDEVKRLAKGYIKNYVPD